LVFISFLSSFFCHPFSQAPDIFGVYEQVLSSETLVKAYQTIPCHILEDGNLESFYSGYGPVAVHMNRCWSIGFQHAGNVLKTSSCWIQIPLHVIWRGGAFYDVSVGILQSVERYGGIWAMNWTAFGRKRPWPNWGTIPTFASKNWGKPWHTSDRILGVRTEIRTEYLPDTSLQRYRYESPLDKVAFRNVLWLQPAWNRKVKKSSWI
jgi:hypothetical protein